MSCAAIYTTKGDHLKFNQNISLIKKLLILLLNIVYLVNYVLPIRTDYERES